MERNNNRCGTKGKQLWNEKIITVERTTRCTENYWISHGKEV